jgi:hypothetical protein
MPSERVTPTLAAALSAAALAGCGGDDPVVADRDGVLRVELREYRVEPARLRVAAGPVGLVATNRGRLTHNAAIVTLPDPGDPEEELGRTDTAFPGEVVRLRDGRVDLAPGRYRIVCTLQNHDNLGQYGELEVVPASDL